MIFMVLSSCQSHYSSSPGSVSECRLSSEVAANLQTMPTVLNCSRSRATGWVCDGWNFYISIILCMIKTIRKKVLNCAV